MSVVNWGEVAQKCYEFGSDPETVKDDVAQLGLKFVAFEVEHADRSAVLWKVNARAGLALGDRACLALAYARGLPVLTGDRDWLRADTGVNIELFRP